MLKGIMCVTGDLPDLVPYAEIERDIRNGSIQRGSAGTTDWPFLKIAANPGVRDAIDENVEAFMPGIFRTFTNRELTVREREFLKNPMSWGDWSETAGGGIGPVMDEDFDPAYIAVSLWESGELELARSWAYWGTRMYE